MNIEMQARLVIVSLGLFCLTYGHGQVWAEQSGDSDAPTVIGPLYKFTSKLFSTLNDGSLDESKNIVVSPISIHKALNMVLLGTDADTATERELLDTIGYGGLSKAEIQKCHEDYARVLAKFKKLKAEALVAMKSERREDEQEYVYRRRMGSLPPLLDLFNMVITKNRAELLPEYKSKVEQFYESSLENVDDRRPETKTKVMEHLNDWAKDAGFDSLAMTQAELDEKFEAILLSAIRVQATWVYQYQESQGEAIFYNQGLKNRPVAGTQLSDDSVEAKYQEFSSAKTDERFKRFETEERNVVHEGLRDLNARVVQVPLVGGLSFTIFEPLEHSSPGDNKLNKLVEQLFSGTANSTQETRLARSLQLLDSKSASMLHLTMPKFKFENELDLKEFLISMGLSRAFDEWLSQISQMTGDRLYIDKALHQAVIDVNHRGIKAAGVTKIKMKYLSVFHSPRVSITKPFVFIIRYGKIPLFVGQLSNLQSSSAYNKSEL